MNNQQNRTQTTSTLSYNTSLHNLPNPKEKINIVSHNVRGLNNITKKQLWEDFCITNNFNIISLTETKLTDFKTKFFNTNHFTYYLTNSDTSREGTGIMISNYLKSHIYKIQKHKGGAIAIDLFFKNDFKFRIISVYLSSGDITRRNKTQTAPCVETTKSMFYDNRTDVGKTCKHNLTDQMQNSVIYQCLSFQIDSTSF